MIIRVKLIIKITIRIIITIIYNNDIIYDKFDNEVSHYSYEYKF